MYAFGSSPHCGSPNEVVDIAGADIVPARDGLGYWMVAADGGIFAFSSPF